MNTMEHMSHSTGHDRMSRACVAFHSQWLVTFEIRHPRHEGQSPLRFVMKDGTGKKTPQTPGRGAGGSMGGSRDTCGTRLGQSLCDCECVSVCDF